MNQPYVIDDRVNNQFRVHRDAYTSEEVLQKEREEIFDKSWLYVGHVSEIPRKGDFKTREVGGRPIIFNRDRNNEVQVQINSCLHRGAALCRHESGNAAIFTCFYHGWAYRNSGELVNVPGGDDYATDQREVFKALTRPAQVDSYRGLYFANFSEDAPSLHEYLGDARYFIDLAADQSPEGVVMIEGTHKYTMQANWKLLVENSIDGYHAKSVHHTYFEMMMELGGVPPMLGDKTINGVPPAGMAVEFENGHASLMYPANPLPLATESVKESLAQLRQKAVDNFGEDYATAMFGLARNSVFFPNMLIIDLNFGLTLRTAFPVSPSETQVTSWQIMPVGVDEEFEQYRIENALTFCGLVGLDNAYDVETLEQAQKAFNSQREIAYSDISKGMGKVTAAANDELQIRAWWREWNRVMVGEKLQPEGTAFVPFQKQTSD